MPLGSLLHFLGRLITPTFTGSHAKSSNSAPTLGISCFGISSEIPNEHNLIQPTRHLISLLLSILSLAHRGSPAYRLPTIWVNDKQLLRGANDGVSVDRLSKGFC